MMRRALLLLLITGCKHEGAPPDNVGAREQLHATPPAPRPRPANLTRVTIKALGMYCEESCPLKVRTALAEVPAVYELGFDVSTESIFVSYDASLGTPKDVTRPMIAAIKSAGFDPWLAKETWPDGADAHVVTR
ncbi:MAG: heavy-metal-associated domain-containing protein [Kofleriaceae bacterium]|nr:heavy-metal-associated domain-containing protein [Kofleriaceae bacterium]